MGGAGTAAASASENEPTALLAGREIINAIFYVLRGGTSWWMLPPCFAPRQTVYGWFATLCDTGVWQGFKH